MAARNLLVELLVEELPPKALKMLGDAFASLLAESLKARELVAADAIVTSFATPRRLATHITGVADVAPDQEVVLKLMPAAVAIGKDGKPTEALRKRLAKEGRATLADLWPNATDGSDRLFVQSDGKTDAVFLRRLSAGTTLPVGLQSALEEAVRKLPIPKVMSYQLADGWDTVNFVRPAHGLVALYGAKVIAVSVLGIEAGRTTHGHRFEATRAVIELKDADSYAQQLQNEGAVLASFSARREEISRQLQAAAVRTGLKPIEDEALLDEVTALVERPNVLLCRFEPEFLEVPQECLILTMKANQKYFPLLTANNKLSNQFLVVSNIHPADPGRVIEGNERVVRPRLADAKFFFDQDRKKPLISHLEGLGKVVYHNKLGSQLDRITRIKNLLPKLFLDLATDTLANIKIAEQAADLCKCDLLTLMVGEFPELQGIMGRYYALADGKSAEIAESIREHYLPRGAGDELPATVTGMALALADRIDTIAGVFAIDQKPTGAKDQFGVRRAAIGILRIIVERKLAVDLVALIEQAVRLQPIQPAALKPNVANEVYDYIMERLRGYYLEESAQLIVTTEMFDAVLATRPASPLDFDQRIRALYDFLQLSEAQSLAAANKRISNILRKSGQESFGAVDNGLLRDPAEQILSEQVMAMSKAVEPMFATRDYTRALRTLAALRAAVDSFFDGVMVMTDEIAVRNNRLALLAQLRSLFLRVADLSRLPG